ncbi:MAG: hypothetical protein ACO1Q7_00810 [Gemmatimonas sp.]
MQALLGSHTAEECRSTVDMRLILQQKWHRVSEGQPNGGAVGSKHLCFHVANAEQRLPALEHLIASKVARQVGGTVWDGNRRADPIREIVSASRATVREAPCNEALHFAGAPMNGDPR